MNINKIIKGELFKVISFNSLTVVSRLISSFIISKVSAVYLGPSGLALLGNFKNVFQGIIGVTSTGFQSGVIKHIAESKLNNDRLSLVISNVLVFNVFISICIAPFILYFSKELSVYVLVNEHYSFIFKYFAIVLPIISVNFLIIYIINGLQEYKLYTKLFTLSNILNALVTFAFIYFFDLKGALLSSILVPVLVFFVSLSFKIIRDILFKAISDFKKFSISFLKSISIYLIMSIYSSILIAVSYLLIRNNLIDSIDTQSAGMWEAVNKISGFYMIFFSSLMTFYLLPKLSKNDTLKGYYGIMGVYFKTLIPIIILTFSIIFLLKTFIIKLLLTNEFLMIKEFLWIQLFADFFKILGFSLAYQFHAKKMIVPYLVTDAILYLGFYFLSVFLVFKFNLAGVFIAYLASTFLYFIFVITFIISTKQKYLKLNV